MTKHQATARETLQMAIVGFEIQRNRIEAAINEIQAALRAAGIRSVSISTAPKANNMKGKSPLSAAGRKRIAEAQRKRWAEFRAVKRRATATKHTTELVESTIHGRPVHMKGARAVARMRNAAPKLKVKAAAPKPDSATTVLPTQPATLEIPESSAPPVLLAEQVMASAGNQSEVGNALV